MRIVLISVLAILAALVSAFFYLSDPDIQRSTLEAKYATLPSQFVLLADGARAHVRDRGPRAAHVLVLLHGFQVSLFTCERWASRLDNTLRVVTMDMRGHGLTGALPSGDYTQAGMVEFVKAVADKLGRGKFAVGGHSMGGGIAARFAETYPARIAQLVLVDAVGMAVKPRGKAPLILRVLRAPVLNEVLLHVRPRSVVVHGLSDEFVRKSIVTDVMIHQYCEFLRVAGHSRGHICTLRPAPKYLHQGSHWRRQGADVDPLGQRGS